MPRSDGALNPRLPKASAPEAAPAPGPRISNGLLGLKVPTLSRNRSVDGVALTVYEMIWAPGPKASPGSRCTPGGVPFGSEPKAGLSAWSTWLFDHFCPPWHVAQRLWNTVRPRSRTAVSVG